MLNLEQNDGLLSAISAAIILSYGAPVHFAYMLVVVALGGARLPGFRF